MAGMLYLVPTPIGNLGDISVRCREILAQADFIAAEDTRVTLKLLNHLELKKPLVSYYEHNKASSGGKILDRIQAGEVCALVSDAGSPAISDPGEDLVRQCAEADIPVSAVPGPCAVITALSISGLPTGRFTFEGFLSTAKKSRNQHLEALRTETRTMVFYEAPHKLLATLGADQAPRGSDPHHTGRGCAAVPSGSTQRGIRPGPGGRHAGARPRQHLGRGSTSGPDAHRRRTLQEGRCPSGRSGNGPSQKCHLRRHLIIADFSLFFCRMLDRNTRIRYNILGRVP